MIVLHRVKKFPSLWEIWSYVNDFTTARHLSLSRASWIQPHGFPSFLFTFLFVHLGLPNVIWYIC